MYLLGLRYLPLAPDCIPLFSDDPVAETWGDGLEVAEERRFRLTEIFEAGLHLKASMVRVDQSFEFVIFPPGTSPIRERTSDIDDQGTGYADPEQNGDNWLAASIHLYKNRRIITSRWIERCTCPIAEFRKEIC